MPLGAGRCRLQCFDYCWPDSATDARALRFLSRRISRGLLRLDAELAASTQAGLAVPGYAVERAMRPCRAPVAGFRQWLSASAGRALDLEPAGLRGSSRPWPR